MAMTRSFGRSNLNKYPA